jgi:hypothetical protein
VGFGADSPPILVELADDGGGAIKNQPAGSVQNQAEYLRRWASDTAEHCWVNIFSELLIKTNCTEDAARVISEETDAIRQVNTDRWIAARSSANRGLAMARLKNYDGCVDSLFEAADIFMSLAHHREVIECLCHVVTETPLRPEWHGNSISVWCAEMSGRNYDPYQLGMYNLVAGIGFSELKDDRKMAFAERYFFVGAGYARKCGDSPLLIKCLEHLSQFFRSTNRPGEEEQCVAEVKRIKGLIGISQLNTIAPEGNILRKCDAAARRDTHRSILGETVIVLAITLALGSLAMLFVSDPVQRVRTFLMIFVAGAGIKIWNVKKASVKYRHIDRV